MAARKGQQQTEDHRGNIGGNGGKITAKKLVYHENVLLINRVPGGRLRTP